MRQTQNQIVLFEEECELIYLIHTRKIDQVRSREWQLFDERDLEVYINAGYLYNLFLSEAVGRYVATCNEFNDVVAEISSESMRGKCECGSLILSDFERSSDMSKTITKNLRFSGVVRGKRKYLSGRELRELYKKYKNSWLSLYGTLHSHLDLDYTEDKKIELGDYPSPGDLSVKYEKKILSGSGMRVWSSGNARILVGTVRPEKGRVYLYKLKAPFYGKSVPELESITRDPLFCNVDNGILKEIVRKHYLREEIAIPVS